MRRRLASCEHQLRDVQKKHPHPARWEQSRTTSEQVRSKDEELGLCFDFASTLLRHCSIFSIFFSCLLMHCSQDLSNFFNVFEKIPFFIKKSFLYLKAQNLNQF